MIKKILSGDYSQEGFADGVADSQAGKSKDVRGVYRAINPLNFIWRYPIAEKSYMANYHRGYDGWQYRHHGITGSETGSCPSTNSQFPKFQKGSNMEYYRRHIAAINDCVHEFHVIIGKFQESLSRYQSQIQSASVAGFKGDYIDPLETKRRNLERQVQILMDYLVRLIKKLNECIEDLEEMARKAAQDGNM